MMPLAMNRENFMKNKKLIIVLCFAVLMMQCEQNNEEGRDVNNCGLETTFIKDIDNIDELGNASGSAIKMVDDCGYVGVGHRTGLPWITKFNELGEQVWDKVFDEIPIPTGNYGNGLIYATGVDKTSDGGFVIVCATTSNHSSYNEQVTGKYQ